jgi:hypothetical protein
MPENPAVTLTTKQLAAIRGMLNRGRPTGGFGNSEFTAYPLLSVLLGRMPGAPGWLMWCGLIGAFVIFAGMIIVHLSAQRARASEASAALATFDGHIRDATSGLSRRDAEGLLAQVRSVPLPSTVASSEEVSPTRSDVNGAVRPD